jgi:hypothetical protein
MSRDHRSRLGLVAPYPLSYLRRVHLEEGRYIIWLYDWDWTKMHFVNQGSTSVFHQCNIYLSVYRNRIVVPIYSDNGTSTSDELELWIPTTPHPQLESGLGCWVLSSEEQVPWGAWASTGEENPRI